MLTVTKQLRKAVERSTMSRYRLSQLTGIDQARLSRFVHGGRLTMDQADQLCAVLKLQLTGKARKDR